VTSPNNPSTPGPRPPGLPRDPDTGFEHEPLRITLLERTVPKANAGIAWATWAGGTVLSLAALAAGALTATIAASIAGAVIMGAATGLVLYQVRSRPPRTGWMELDPRTRTLTFRPPDAPAGTGADTRSFDEVLGLRLVEREPEVPGQSRSALYELELALSDQTSHLVARNRDVREISAVMDRVQAVLGRRT